MHVRTYTHQCTHTYLVFSAEKCNALMAVPQRTYQLFSCCREILRGYLCTVHSSSETVLDTCRINMLHCAKTPAAGLLRSTVQGSMSRCWMSAHSVFWTHSHLTVPDPLSLFINGSVKQPSQQYIHSKNLISAPVLRIEVSLDCPCMVAWWSGIFWV